MKTTIGEKIKDIEEYYFRKFKDKSKYENLEEYKFIMLLCNKMPYLEMDTGFVDCVGWDNVELICDVISNFDITNMPGVDELTNFIQLLSETKGLKSYVNLFFFFLDTFYGQDKVYEQIKSKLQDSYIEYCLDYYKD